MCLSEKPNVGDLISCTDGDVAIVLGVEEHFEEGDIMIRALWCRAGKVYTDPWGSEDFMEGRGMFSILNPATHEDG